MGSLISCCFGSATQENPVMQKKPRKSDDIWFNADKEKLKIEKKKKYGEVDDIGRMSS